MPDVSLTIGQADSGLLSLANEGLVFVIGLFTLAFTLVQIATVTGSFNAANLTKALEILLSDDEVRKLRKAMFRKDLSASLVQEKDEGDQGYADRQAALWKIATLHDRYAMIANSAGFSRHRILLFQIDEIRKTWEMLEGFIKGVRKNEGRPHYCSDLERLAKYSRCLWFRVRTWPRLRGQSDSDRSE